MPCGPVRDTMFSCRTRIRGDGGRSASPCRGTDSFSPAWRGFPFLLSPARRCSIHTSSSTTDICWSCSHGTRRPLRLSKFRSSRWDACKPTTPRQKAMASAWCCLPGSSRWVKASAGCGLRGRPLFEGPSDCPADEDHTAASAACRPVRNPSDSTPHRAGSKSYATGPTSVTVVSAWP